MLSNWLSLYCEPASLVWHFYEAQNQYFVFSKIQYFSCLHLPCRTKCGAWTHKSSKWVKMRKFRFDLPSQQNRLINSFSSCSQWDSRVGNQDPSNLKHRRRTFELWKVIKLELNTLKTFLIVGVDDFDLNVAPLVWN